MYELDNEFSINLKQEFDEWFNKFAIPIKHDRYSMIYGVDDEEMFDKLTKNENITREEFIALLMEHDRNTIQEELPDGTPVGGDNTGTMIFIMEAMDNTLTDDTKNRIMGLFANDRDVLFNSKYDGFLSFILSFPKARL